MDRFEIELERLRAEVEKLPHGYVSYKEIYGVVRAYLQWRDKDTLKIKSQYIKESDLPETLEAIAFRKYLEASIKKIEGYIEAKGRKNPKYAKNYEF